jgi:hypothetical protein
MRQRGVTNDHRVTDFDAPANRNISPFTGERPAFLWFQFPLLPMEVLQSKVFGTWSKLEGDLWVWCPVNLSRFVGGGE